MSDYQLMLDNLTAAQARCTALLEENRALKNRVSLNAAFLGARAQDPLDLLRRRIAHARRKAALAHELYLLETSEADTLEIDLRKLMEAT